MEAAQAVKDRLDSLDTQKVLELIRLELEVCKDQFVKCDELEFERLQGKAQAYDGLIRLMTRPSLVAVKEQNG